MKIKNFEINSSKSNYISAFLFIFTYESGNDTLQDFALQPIYGSMLQKDSNQLSDQFLIY
jgi:hypothetical protein